MTNISTISDSKFDLSAIVKLMDKYQIRTPHEDIFCHPIAADRLKDEFPLPPEDPSVPLPIYRTFGVPVYTNPLLPAYGKKWEFPRDPFVDYEVKDESWARPIGYGKEVEDPDNPVFFQVNFDLIKDRISQRISDRLFSCNY